MSNVASYYEQQAQREWQRLERHRTEFAVTLRALAAHLPASPGPVPDIGPGRYAIALAQQGYRVTLLDLAQQNLALARQQADAAGVQLAAYLHADATYAGVLLLGPLYHLLSVDERAQAIREACRALQAGGILFAAFITRFAFIRDAAANDPHWLIRERERAATLLHTGVNRGRLNGDFTDAYFAHPDEIRPLLERHGLETLALLGCEGVVAQNERRINTLSGAEWETWVDLNYRLGASRACTEPPIIYCMSVGRRQHLKETYRWN